MRLVQALSVSLVLVACASDAKSVGDSQGDVFATPHATPEWANVAPTISPEWGAFFSKKGKGRETPVPTPNDLEGWKAMQAANDEAKEAAAVKRAPGFGVTHQEGEIAGISVV